MLEKDNLSMLQRRVRRGKRGGKVEKCSTWNMTILYVYDDMYTQWKRVFVSSG